MSGGCPTRDSQSQWRSSWGGRWDDNQSQAWSSWDRWSWEDQWQSGSWGRDNNNNNNTVDQSQNASNRWGRARDATPADQATAQRQSPDKGQAKGKEQANTGSRKGKAQDTESSGKAGPKGGSPAKGAEATAKAKAKATAKATAKSTAKGKAKGTPRHGKGKGTVSAEPSPAILDPASTANSWEWGLDSPEGLYAVVSSS